MCIGGGVHAHICVCVYMYICVCRSGVYYMHTHVHMWWCVCVCTGWWICDVLNIFIAQQLEDLPPAGLVHPGPRTFISQQNKFGEETKAFLQSAQEMIGEV